MPLYLLKPRDTQTYLSMIRILAGMSFSYGTFSRCISDGWTLTIGDPNIMGWSVFAAYAVAAGFAAMVISALARDGRHREQVFWGLIGLAMAALALNKQLDLQTLLTAAGRCLAKEQGWYENRRLVQRDFIFALFGLVALSGTMMFWMLHGKVRKNRLPLWALGILAAFVLTRAMHFYHVLETQVVFLDWFYHALPATLEVLCPALIIVAAWKLLRPPAALPA